jgi:hypothetical protein
MRCFDTLAAAARRKTLYESAMPLTYSTCDGNAGNNGNYIDLLWQNPVAIHSAKPATLATMRLGFVACIMRLGWG